MRATLSSWVSRIEMLRDGSARALFEGQLSVRLSSGLQLVQFGGNLSLCVEERLVLRTAVRVVLPPYVIVVLGWHQRRWALQRIGRCAVITPL